jgi:phosphate uptake regulator
MKRKVIQIAGKTFVISLPTSWVKQWGIKKGEEIDVVEQGSKLIVSTGESRDIKKGSVDISRATERTIRWVLSSLHKKGYDEIEIATDNENHARLIDELLRDLFMGFAVVEQKGKKCVVKTVSKDLDDQFDTILRRAFLVTLDFSEKTVDYAEKKQFEELTNLVQLEKTNNQLTNFCERILNKRGYDDQIKTNFLYVIIWNLEKVADDYKYLCQYLAKEKKINKKSLVVLKEVNSLLRNYYELFYKFDINKLSKLSEDLKTLRNKIEKLLPEDPVVLAHVLHIVLKTADFSASTFALHN